MRVVILLFLVFLILGCTIEKPGEKPIDTKPPVKPSANISEPTDEKTVNKIALGSSFGNCAGYCIASLVITKNSVVYRKIGIPYPDARQYIPELNTTRNVSKQEWEDILKSVNLDTLEKLPEKIGCPDCYDQGAESLLVWYNSKNKSVSFSYGENPEGLESLLTKLRDTQNEMETLVDADSKNFVIYNYTS